MHRNDGFMALGGHCRTALDAAAAHDWRGVLAACDAVEAAAAAGRGAGSQGSSPESPHGSPSLGHGARGGALPAAAQLARAEAFERLGNLPRAEQARGAGAVACRL